MIYLLFAPHPIYIQNAFLWKTKLLCSGRTLYSEDTYRSLANFYKGLQIGVLF